MIRRVKQEDIDFLRYKYRLENCCQNADYAQKEFLDIVTGKNWELLVYGDYEAVMPIPLKIKMGVRMVIMPMLTQQLGIFSKIDNQIMNQIFLDEFLKSYAIVSYNFNSINQFQIPLNKKVSYILDKNSYEIVKKNYTINRRRNVRITEKIKNRIEIKKTASIDQFENFIIHNLKGVEKKSTKLEYIKIVKKLLKSDLLKANTIYFDGVLQSLGLFYIGNHRDYLSLFINAHPLKDFNIPSIQIDQYLQNIISHKSFDFMGSNVETVAEFNSRFGAIAYEYSVLSQSRLNVLIQIPFKRYAF